MGISKIHWFWIFKFRLIIDGHVLAIIFFVLTFILPIVVWHYPILGVYLAIFCAFFLDWATEELALLPHYYTWLIEYLIVILSLRILGISILKKGTHLS